MSCLWLPSSAISPWGQDIEIAMQLFLLFLAACSSPETVEEPELEVLTVAERAARIQTLMDGATGAEEEAEILTLFREVRGGELLELKRALDAGPTDEGLHHLVHSDIDDEQIRGSLLQHFQEAGQLPSPRPMRVVSDIDDTILCRLHDDRYPKGVTYPGVVQLFAELGGGVTFLSARPGDRAGVYETITISMLQERGFTDFTLLHGSLIELRSTESMAEGKYRNLVQYRELYPEYTFVIFGDSGQRDVDFAARVLREFPEDVLAAYIHQLSPEPAAGEPVEGLLHVETWAHAALDAYRKGWLTEEAAGRVVRASREALDTMDFEEEERATMTALYTSAAVLLTP